MSSDLYSINTELMEVQRLIGARSISLADRREKLSRLQKALTDLRNNKSDFYETEGICSKPEFAAKSFHGNHARDLTELKEGELRENFAYIPDHQIVAVEDKILEKIRHIEGEMGSLESSISALESRRSTLQVRKQEVQSQA
jgi:septation ring formation regulator EzrA